MVVSSRPIRQPMMVLTGSAPTIEASVANAKIIKATYSAGPNFMAKRPSSGAKNVKSDNGKHPAHERGKSAYGEGFGTPALLGERIAVDGGHHGARVAGYVDQDRCDAPAVLGAVVDGREQDHAALGGQFHRVGDRQHERDAVDRPDRRQGADQRAEKATDDGIEEVARRERDRKAGPQIVE